MHLARRCRVRVVFAISFVVACARPVAVVDVDAGVDATIDSGADALVAWQAHADTALETLLVRYWMPSAAYLGAIAPSNRTLTQYWTFAQALDAVIDGVARTGRYAGWIEALYLAQNARGWSRDYYHDENWMALALLR